MQNDPCDKTHKTCRIALPLISCTHCRRTKNFCDLYQFCKYVFDKTEINFLNSIWARVRWLKCVCEINLPVKVNEWKIWARSWDIEVPVQYIDRSVDSNRIECSMLWATLSRVMSFPNCTFYALCTVFRNAHRTTAGANIIRAHWVHRMFERKHCK